MFFWVGGKFLCNILLEADLGILFSTSDIIVASQTLVRKCTEHEFVLQ